MIAFYTLCKWHSPLLCNLTKVNLSFANQNHPTPVPPAIWSLTKHQQYTRTELPVPVSYTSTGDSPVQSIQVGFCTKRGCRATRGSEKQIYSIHAGKQITGSEEIQHSIHSNITAQTIPSSTQQGSQSTLGTSRLLWTLA